MTRWSAEQYDAAVQKIKAGSTAETAAGRVMDNGKALDRLPAPKPVRQRVRECPQPALKRAQRVRVAAKTVSGLQLNPEPLRAFKLFLSWPPTANHGTKHANGRHYLTRAHLDYRKLVAIEVLRAGVRLIRGRYRMELTFYPPDRRRRDADNLLKVLADALVKAGAIADDCNMRQLNVYWQEWNKDQAARVVVAVCEV